MYYYARQQSRVNPFAGVSVFNLLQPKETFFNADNRLPMRLYVHLGTRVNITELIYVLPKVLIQSQEKFAEQTFAADAGFYLKRARTLEISYGNRAFHKDRYARLKGF